MTLKSQANWQQVFIESNLLAIVCKGWEEFYLPHCDHSKISIAQINLTD